MTTQMPAAVRTTAAALAVFVTVVTLNGVVSMAEPQRGEIMVQAATRHAADTPRQAMLMAQATPEARSH